MGTINLYKIDERKCEVFLGELNQRMEEKQSIFIRKTVGTEELVFEFSLYISNPRNDKQVKWDWVLTEFGQPMIEVPQAPKAIIVIKTPEEKLYAVSFGSAFFMVDKYCDRDFGFSFARKQKYKEIKTTTLTSPGSQRNKTVNTYINYSELDFESGESYAKLKAKIDLPEEFELYKESIEIGSSIRFNVADESLGIITSLIMHIENTLIHVEDQCKIPVFTKVKNDLLLQKLEENLRKNISEAPAQINISELDIIGATEIFNNNDGEFILEYKKRKKRISVLNADEIKRFCDENNWEYGETVLDISVTSYYNDMFSDTNQIKNLIDYTDDEEKCLLSKGMWYKYNEDFLSYLNDSIANMPVEYNAKYDFSKGIHEKFIQEKYLIEKDGESYINKSEKEIKADLRNKYYAERVFNLLREQQDGFTNFDRSYKKVENVNVEEMDLYKDETMYVVKIGNTSSKLVYAIDQSLSSLKLYKKNKLDGMPKIKTVALWFVLERQTHIEDESGKPDLNKLEMLILKIRLDQWIKEVRMQGFQPIIYINYRTK